jgi:hypothetical protein
MGRLSLKRLTAESLEGGLLYWVPWDMKGRFWGWACLFMGLIWAIWRGLVYWGLVEMAERGYGGEAFLSMGFL